MDQIGVAVDFAAGETGGEGMVGVALYLGHAAVFDVCEDRAHVGAVMGADGADDGHGAVPGVAI